MIIDAEQGSYNHTPAYHQQRDDVFYPPPSSYPNNKDPRTQMVARTPSPTPSEARALNEGVLDWKRLRSWRFWIRREWLWYYVALILICTITALVTIYHEQIVEWLRPVSEWLRDDFEVGWLVPIAVLFVISFPPLFGHEIVAVLCGLVWGLWIGFGIVCAGTFLGEVGNFYAFKYCCRARGEKLERSKLPYACLARVVRDGGFKIALIARLSAIPGHFTTAVFSTCGMGIVVFCLAAILSLPKQFITVYLGVILEQSANGDTDPKSRIISNVVLAITFLITVLAMWYIFRQMNKVKPQVIYDRRKARQAKLASITPMPEGSSSQVNLTAYPGPSSSGIPMRSNSNHSTTFYPFSQDSQQRPDLHAPKPMAADAYTSPYSYSNNSKDSEARKPAQPWTTYHSETATSRTHLSPESPDDESIPLSPPGIATPTSKPTPLPRTLVPGGGASPMPPEYSAPSYPPPPASRPFP